MRIIVRCSDILENFREIGVKISYQRQREGRSPPFFNMIQN
nr:MAG TPA: hypothetical protein [Caudoviricetes sp.]